MARQGMVIFNTLTDICFLSLKYVFFVARFPFKIFTKMHHQQGKQGNQQNPEQEKQQEDARRCVSFSIS